MKNLLNMLLLAVMIILLILVLYLDINKEQKVIKVPNTEVFKIVAPQLISRGISRIISDDKLIAL